MAKRERGENGDRLAGQAATLMARAKVQLRRTSSRLKETLKHKAQQRRAQEEAEAEEAEEEEEDDSYSSSDEDEAEAFVPKRRPSTRQPPRAKRARRGDEGTYKERALKRARELAAPTDAATVPRRSAGSREARAGALCGDIGGSPMRRKKGAARVADPDKEERARLEASGLVGIHKTVLPAAFGAFSYDVLDVVVAASQRPGVGLGFSLKNIDERAVVRGFHSRASTSGLACNDVVLSVGNLDARAHGFHKVVARAGKG